MKLLYYILIAALAFTFGRCSRPYTCNRDPEERDTITSPPVVITKVKVDSLYILRPLPYLAWVENTDTIRPSDSCYHLREYKEYQDSNYYAKISGIQPRLDEIRIYPKTTTKYTYQEKIVAERGKKFGVGISAGYGISSKGIVPCIGISVNYNIIQW